MSDERTLLAQLDPQAKGSTPVAVSSPSENHICSLLQTPSQSVRQKGLYPSLVCQPMQAPGFIEDSHSCWQSYLCRDSVGGRPL